MADASGSSKSVDRKKQHKAPFDPTSEEEEEDDEVEVPYIVGKHFFDVILTKSHFQRSSALILPASMVQLLPRATVPVSLTYKGKVWNLSYRGDCHRPTLDRGWKGFVTDNDLKCGDACVFELVGDGRGNLKFKVLILRGDLPPELAALMDSRGTTFEAPIVLD